MNRIEAALSRLSINLPDYDNPRLTLSQCTENFHDAVKRRFRLLALERHPDVEGDHEAMIALTGARDLLMECEIRRIPKPQPIQWRFVYAGFRFTDDNTTSSTMTGTTWK